MPFFLSHLTPAGYAILGLIVLVAVSLFSYLWKTFRTIAWLLLAASIIGVLYYGFDLGRDSEFFIISVPGLR